MAAQLEEQRERGHHPEHRLLRTARLRPFEGGVEVVVLEVEACEPHRPFPGDEGGRCLLGEPEEEVEVPAANGVALTRLDESFARVLADGLEQAVAAALVVDLHERLVDQPGDQLEHRVRVDQIVGAHGLGRLEREAAGEHREPAQHRALLVVEEVVTPRDRRFEGLLAGHDGLPAAGEQPEPVVERLGDAGRLHHPHPRGGELDRQWKVIEASADPSDVGTRSSSGSNVGRARRAFDEQHAPTPHRATEPATRPLRRCRAARGSSR